MTSTTTRSEPAAASHDAYASVVARSDAFDARSRASSLHTPPMYTARLTPPRIATASRSSRGCAIAAVLLARRPAELGWTLLDVRRQTFSRVGPAKAVELVGERRVERGRHHAVPVIQGVLGPAKRALRAGCERRRDAERACVHLVVVDTQRDQPDALGFFTRHRFARQQVVLRLRHATQQRPADGGVITGCHSEARVTVDDPR